MRFRGTVQSEAKQAAKASHMGVRAKAGTAALTGAMRRLKKKTQKATKPKKKGDKHKAGGKGKGKSGKA